MHDNMKNGPAPFYFISSWFKKKKKKREKKRGFKANFYAFVLRPSSVRFKNITGKSQINKINIYNSFKLLKTPQLNKYIYFLKKEYILIFLLQMKSWI